MSAEHNNDRAAAGARVFIVDDHVLFRTGLRALLEENGVQAIGEAGDAEHALEQIAALRPDVVLMDLSLPGMSGVEATRRLAALAPEIRILILTVTAVDQTVVDAVRAGASGYLVKGAPIEDLVETIEAAARGQASLSPEATAVVFEQLRSAPERRHPAEAETDLTVRELEVLALVVEGKENIEIAQALSISLRTVKHHLSSIFAKLDVPNRTLAAVEAVSRGLI